MTEFLSLEALAARIPDGTQLNARFTLDEFKLFGDNFAKVSLWGRNLLNERHIEYNFGLGGTVVANTFQRPRSFGIDFSTDF